MKLLGSEDLQTRQHLNRSEYHVGDHVNFSLDKVDHIVYWCHDRVNQIDVEPSFGFGWS